MSKTTICPLCQSNASKLLEILKSKALQKMYWNVFNMDIGPFISLSRIEYLECEQCHLHYFHPVIPASSAIYQILQNSPGYYAQSKEEYSIAAEWIPEDSNVLEVGCGEGAFSRYIRTKNYTGIELNPQAVQVARDKGVNVSLSSIEKIVNEKYLFDVVCCFQVLEHVPDPGRFLAHMVKCIKAGGQLIIAVPAFDSFLGFTANNALNLPPHHLTHWPDATFAYLESMLGLRLVTLVHEPLPKEQWFWFSQVLIRQLVFSSLKRENMLLDRRPLSRIINWIADVLAKKVSGNVLEKLAPRGQNVLALFQNAHSSSQSK